MKHTSIIVTLSAILLLSSVESFSTNTLPQQHAASRTELFRSPAQIAAKKMNGIQMPQITPGSKTSLSAAAPAVGAIAGALTGGILGGALHAIAGKYSSIVNS
jgi:hypothetical protein